MAVEFLTDEQAPGRRPEQRPTASLRPRRVRPDQRRRPGHSHDGPLGRSLLSALAEAARICGWLHFDIGRHAAQSFYITSLRASASAGVPEAGANTLQFMAIQTYSQGNPQDAVNLVRTSQEQVSGRTTPRVRALLHARAGRALSKTGDAKGCAREFDRARDAYATGPHDDDPPWAYSVTEGEIEMLAGSSALDLRDPREALDGREPLGLGSAIGMMMTRARHGRPGRRRKRPRRLRHHPRRSRTRTRRSRPGRGLRCGQRPFGRRPRCARVRHEAALDRREADRGHQRACAGCGCPYGLRPAALARKGGPATAAADPASQTMLVAASVRERRAAPAGYHQAKAELAAGTTIRREQGYSVRVTAPLSVHTGMVGHSETLLTQSLAARKAHLVYSRRVLSRQVSPTF